MLRISNNINSNKVLRLKLSPKEQLFKVLLHYYKLNLVKNSFVFRKRLWLIFLL